ncbi:translation initiation factor IF-2 N-terminal domain-containing protein, partial [Solidesulfovibrio sp.]|uniref:translation initiation factor IF-2 N-terminal domain-containing protein n=1 Tax=Solidesulfovibrio sp. TaxID=2910990 RepID=UPI002628FC2E
MNKIRIKDITKDLGIGQKELLHILRELGIQVKSQMGTLSDEEAAQVRARVRQGETGRTQIIDTEVQPGVIVRRRKAAPTPPAQPAPPEASTESAPTAATPPAAAVQAPVDAPVEEDAEDEVHEALKDQSFPEFEQEEAEPAPAKPAPARPVILETARVIRPAGAPEPAAPPAAPQAPEETPVAAEAPEEPVAPQAPAEAAEGPAEPA